MSTLSNKQPPNHELLAAIKKDMRIRKAGGSPAYVAPPDASREDKLIHFLNYCRRKFPGQPCPITYLSWVIDGGVKRAQENSRGLEGLRALINNKRIKESLGKKALRIFYVPGVGEDGGYRMNVDDEDMAMTVLSGDKRRAQNALHKAAQTHSMIDPSKLVTSEAREHYGDVGAMASLLSDAGYLTLPEMSTDKVKQLHAGITKRRKRATG